MGLRRESNQRMADFAVADVSLFWLLNALNTYQPILADLKAHPARHPESVYRELAKLAGGLLTFSLEHDIEQIPAYRHEQRFPSTVAADFHLAGGQPAIAGHRPSAGGERRQPLEGQPQ
ncbi:hypothetical protein D3C84_943930 [compost metagenome]